LWKKQKSQKIAATIIMSNTLQILKIEILTIHTGWPKKTSRTLRNYNGAYTLWGEISFGTFVDQYVLLLTYKFQWRH